MNHTLVIPNGRIYTFYIEAKVMAYCNALDEEYVAMMEALYPQYCDNVA
jgi:hypothetical protein